jgi:hypothetical protein
VAADRLPVTLVGARRDRGPRRRLEPPLQERRHGLALGRGWLPVRELCLRCLDLGEGLSLGLPVERLAPALATDDPEVEHRDPEPIRRPLVDGTLATPAPASALVQLSLRSARLAIRALNFPSSRHVLTLFLSPVLRHG